MWPGAGAVLMIGVIASGVTFGRFDYTGDLNGALRGPQGSLSD